MKQADGLFGFCARQPVQHTQDWSFWQGTSVEQQLCLLHFTQASSAGSMVQPPELLVVVLLDEELVVVLPLDEEVVVVPLDELVVVVPEDEVVVADPDDEVVPAPPMPPPVVAVVVVVALPPPEPVGPAPPAANSTPLFPQPPPSAAALAKIPPRIMLGTPRCIDPASAARTHGAVRSVAPAAKRVRGPASMGAAQLTPHPRGRGARSGLIGRGGGR
jgi:hypothetical protein